MVVVTHIPSFATAHSAWPFAAAVEAASLVHVFPAATLKAVPWRHDRRVWRKRDFPFPFAASCSRVDRFHSSSSWAVVGPNMALTDKNHHSTCCMNPFCLVGGCLLAYWCKLPLCTHPIYPFESAEKKRSVETFWKSEWWLYCLNA